LKIVESSGKHYVKPTSTPVHKKWTDFYVKVSTAGSDLDTNGPYTMTFGCLSSELTFEDSSSLVPSLSLTVGESGTDAYTFAVPNTTPYLSWCAATSYEIVKTD